MSTKTVWPHESAFGSFVRSDVPMVGEKEEQIADEEAISKDEGGEDEMDEEQSFSLANTISLEEEGRKWIGAFL